MKKLKKFLFRW